MALKGYDNGSWKDASAVYGRVLSGGEDRWLYAKEVYARQGGAWVRAWTDCRKVDADGRGWSPPTTTVTYSGTCGNRTATTTVTRTKDGCPDDVRVTVQSSPLCSESCYDITTDNCDGCGSRTIYTAKAGSSCASYETGSCTTWTSLSNYDRLDICFTVSGGTYGRVVGSIFGWLYISGGGCSANVGCGGSDNLGPGGIEYCSVLDTYRVTGTDICVPVGVGT